MGDGILAYFGYPQAHEDDPERAVLAGLGIVDAVGRLGQDLLDGKAVELAARVGIATGLVVVGDLIGEGPSRESAVVGETPNLAARLQALASPNGVVIAPATRDRLGGLFDFASMGPFHLKGFPKPVNAWKVVKERTVESRFEALRSQRLTPLVGREEELEILMRRWQRVTQGEAQLVLLSGEAGIGKSRTIEALRETLGGERYINLRHQCSPYHKNSALHPVSSRIRHAARITREDSVERQLDKLEALLRQATDDVQAVAPLFAALLSIPAEARYGELKLSSGRQKDQLFAALDEQLYGLASEQPVLCVFEDLHWVDPTTLEYIDSMLRTVVDKRILVILTSRPDRQTPWAGEANATLLNLNKLSQRTCAALIRNIAGGKTLPEEIAQEVLDRTDGVPLFVEELTKTVLESDLLREEPDRYSLVGTLVPRAIPRTLQDSLMARLDRHASVKELAQTAAVIGRDFSHELIRAVSDLPAPEVDAALDSLTDAGLIFRRGTPPEASYTFKHALIQDTAYESLLRSRRQQLHGKIARTLEERFPELVEGEPELAAHHFSAAGLHERAIDCWHAAGRRASRRSANREASGHLSAALSELESLPTSARNDRRKFDLLVESIAPVSAAKGYSAPEFEEIFRAALALHPKLGDTPQIYPVLYARWLFAYGGGQLPEALRHAESFLELARAQNADLPAIVATRCVGNVLLMRGDAAGASRCFRQVIDALDDPTSSALGYTYGHDNLVTARCYHALALGISGFPDQARACYDQALVRARQIGHAQTLVTAHALAGGFLFAALRETDELAFHADAAMSIVEDNPMPFWSVAPRPLLGIRALIREEYEVACRLLAQAISAFESLNFHLWKPVYL